MSDHSIIDDWFDQWDELQEKQQLPLDQFIEQHCQGSPPDVIEAFRSKARAIQSMKHHLAECKAPEPPTVDPGSKQTGEPASGPMDLHPGMEPIPDYRLEKWLGEGGFGQVWQAKGPGGMPVALKFISLSRNDGKAELRALDIFRRVRHPHLLATVGAWQKDQCLIIAMELADCTLQSRFREAVQSGQPGIPVQELLGYMEEAAKGLDFLNEARHLDENGQKVSIQHRDVKPANLLLLGGGIKVSDFGLARLLQGNETSHSGSLTVEFAAPEFFDDLTSTQSDQYSLAVTYCFLRGGRLPFTGTATQIMKGHTQGEPELSTLPQEERPVIRRALAKQPAVRWPSCGAFVAALRQVCVDEEQPLTPVTSPATTETSVAPPGNEDDPEQLRAQLLRNLNDIELRRRYLAVRLPRQRTLDKNHGTTSVVYPVGCLLAVLTVIGLLLSDVPDPCLFSLLAAFLFSILFGILNSIRVIHPPPRRELQAKLGPLPADAPTDLTFAWQRFLGAPPAPAPESLSQQSFRWMSKGLKAIVVVINILLPCLVGFMCIAYVIGGKNQTSPTTTPAPPNSSTAPQPTTPGDR